jgi:class 3 adenylate cyclase
MNIGVHEGQEWLGAIQLGDNIEFTALGDTINTASRLCDIASYGSIWASKSFVTRLQSETRDKLDFGVERTLEADRRQFVPQSFVQVASLMSGDTAVKWQDLGTLAVTEITAISR